MAPRSPDLNPSDFCLWEYLKQKLFDPQLKNLDDLKTSIDNEIKKIKP